MKRLFTLFSAIHTLLFFLVLNQSSLLSQDRSKDRSKTPLNEQENSAPFINNLTNTVNNGHSDPLAVATCYPNIGARNTGTCNSTTITQTSLMTAASPFGVNRCWAKFNVSSIPVGSTITAITISMYVNSSSCPYFYINKVTTDPVTAPVATLYSQIQTGTQFANYGSCLTVGAYNTITLNTSARTDLQTALSQGWWAVGLYEYESGSYTMSAQGNAEANKPYITVTYTAAGCSPLTIPYAESFESITVANTVPNCMAATRLGSYVYTYLTPHGSWNRIPHGAGTKFASFRYGCNDWIFTQGLALTGGTTYNYSMWYITDGRSGWTNLQARYGNAQNSAAMTGIITGGSVNNPTNTSYVQMTGSFTPASSGTYYIGINCIATGVPWYLTVDDISVSSGGAMSYVSSTTTQTVTSAVSPGTVNNQIVGIQIVTTGSTSPFNATSFLLNTSGTTNPPNNISNAKLWYTGTSSVFATTTQFGSTFLTPNGAFTINGSQALQNGTNYFWLTYDIPAGATPGNVVDAQCSQITMSGVGGTRVPTVTSPAGYRTIQCAASIGTGTSTAPYPYATYWMDSRTDLLYTAAEISATSCAGGCKYITGLAFNISSYNTFLMNGFNIKMQNTSAASLTGFTSSGWTTVYSGTYSVPGTGWQFITFTTPFPWDGTSNVLVEICYNNSMYASYSYVYSSSTALTMAYYSYTDLPSGNGCTDLISGTATTTRPNIQFVIGGTPPTMAFTSSTSAQPNTNAIGTGALNAELIQIQVVTSGTCSPMNVTSINLNTNGSTNAVTDISAAKIFYTGTSSTFSAINQFGSTFNNPNGAFTISGSGALVNGTNYFWLAYDIRGTATSDDQVDGECTSITVAGTPRTPTVTAPAGSRTILAPLSGGYYVGSGQTYPTLTGTGGLFEAINSAGAGGNITAYITSNITEPGSNSINQWLEQGAGGYTLNIFPADATEKVISGNVAGAMIRFNGSDRVTIDGNGGMLNDASGTKYLRFRNINGSYPTISFLNDARRNTITDCYIESNNTNTVASSAGTVSFGNTTGSSGNDSNTISWCDIRDRSDAAGMPVYAVYSEGTTTTTAQYNNYNTIDNCNIYNFYADAAAYYAGIWLNQGTSDWTITNNSLYQTGARTQNTSATVVYIFNNYNSANNLTVQGNYIGGSAPLCGGTPLTYTGTGAYTFNGIYLYIGGTTASNIHGNTIQNISLTNNSTSGSSTLFRGIYTGPTWGIVNIGTVTGNTIGAGTGNGSIVINTPLALTNSFISNGIYQGSTGNVSNNTIGSITLSGSSTTGSNTFYGISRATLSSSAYTISNNLIGSLTTPNSIQQTSTARPHTIRGIYASINSTGTMNITGNTIANITDFNTSTANSASVYAIQNNGGTGIYNISGNTIRDLREGSGVSGFILLNGIICTGTGTKTISQNIIYNLFLNQPGAGNSNITGILAGGSPGGGTVSRNKLYNVVNSNSGTSQSIYGIWTQSSTSAYTVSNNMISITNGDVSMNKMIDIERSAQQMNLNNKLRSDVNLQTPVISKQEAIISSAVIEGAKKTEILTAPADETLNPVFMPVSNTKSEYTESTDAVNGLLIYGMLNSAAGSLNYYYNTAYIGGTQPGGAAFPSYTLYRTSGTMTLRNNLLINARTGGTGNHVVLGNLSGVPATGWTTSASNYNTLIASNAGTIGEWGTGVFRTIDTWRTSSGGDKQSWSTVTGSFTAGNLFNNFSAGDLTINNANAESWIVSGKGIAVTGQNIDLSGDSRFTAVSSGVTDIGADEFSTPAVSPPDAAFNNAPGSGVTSTYSLWGRTLAVVTWGTGGSSYPSALNVKYYSGVSPGNTLGGNYSNSYWNITPVGSLTGTNYNILLNFGDNETYTIAAPSSNTRLAKYDGSWEVFPIGTGNWQTQLTWNATAFVYSAYVTFLDRFSDFALTDAVSPLPVQLSEFKASVNKNNAVLAWVTESELNNSGFEIERRNLIDQNNNFSSWQSKGFVQGKGTSGNKSYYRFTDPKLNTGTYQYRLKQIDMNGNFEYFTLNSPENVVIGKPLNADVSQNYPNPSNPKSKIDYQLPVESKVTIKVYDILGREVITVVNEIKKEGYYTAEFDGTNISSGTYFYKIIIDGNGNKFTSTKKMIIVK